MEMTKFALWLNRVFAPFDHWGLQVLHKLHRTRVTRIVQLFVWFFDLLGKNGVIFISSGLVLTAIPGVRRIGVSMLLALLIGSLITNVLLKPLVQRPRPYENGFDKQWNNVGNFTQNDASFPSGHTTAAMALSTVLFFITSWSFGWLIFLFALCMALSRCYLMVHYPSDVLCGLIVGFFAGLSAFLILDYFWKEQIF